jgi:nicotinate dehydrogenase subunit B
MKPMNRREFVRKGRDTLIVGFSLHRAIAPAIAWGQTAAPTAPAVKPVIPEELDSWLSIGRDGNVTVYTGRIDMGTGIGTAFGQLVSDELDVPFESVKIVTGDTDLTPDQGKSTGRHRSVTTGTTPFKPPPWPPL